MIGPNHTHHRRFFRNIRGQTNRNKSWFPRNIGSSSSKTAPSHPDIPPKISRAVAPQHPNNEMSEISQLSMDSSFGTNSRTLNEIDTFPLGQPSASMESRSQNQSHCSFGLNLDNRQHRQNIRCPSTIFPIPKKAYAMVPKTGKPTFLLPGTQRNSSLLRKKTRRKKAQKTRFATSPNHAPATSQASCDTSSSISVLASHASSRSFVREGFERSGSRDDVSAVSQSGDHSIIRLGSTLLHHQGAADLGVCDIQMSSNFRREPNPQLPPHSLTSTANRLFVKAATPRQKLNIHYPTLHGQKNIRDMNRKNQGREQRSLHLLADTPKKGRRSGLEIESTFGESVEHENTFSDRKSSTNAKKSPDFQLKRRTSTLGTFSSNSIASHLINECSIPAGLRTDISSLENERQRLSEELKILKDSTNQEIQKFIAKLEEQSSEIQSKAKADFQSTLKAATCEAESKLAKMAEEVNGDFSFKLERHAEKVRDESRFKLDETTEAVQLQFSSKLQQQRNESESAIKKIAESHQVRLECKTTYCMEKIEECAESSVARLSNFTESWLQNASKAIAELVKPYLSLSNKTFPRKKESGNRTNTENFNIHETPSMASRSLRRDSNAELETSLTRGFSQGQKEELPLQQLRRSKRTKQRKFAAYNDQAEEALPLVIKNTSKGEHEYRPNVSPKLKRNSQTQKRKTTLPMTGPLRNEKALCVTPIEGNSRGKAKNQKSDHSHTSHKSLKYCLRSKNESDDSDIILPNEIIACTDVQMSPLKTPNVETPEKEDDRFRKGASGEFKRKPKTFASSRFKRRRTTRSRIFTKRKKIIDVTELESFDF